MIETQVMNVFLATKPLETTMALDNLAANINERFQIDIIADAMNQVEGDAIKAEDSSDFLSCLGFMMKALGIATDANIISSTWPSPSASRT